MSATAAFEQYATWYDAFNRDKDYGGEARYILSQVAAWRPRPRRWLDIGCGTGNHAACLQAQGLTVEGLDASAFMVERARAAHPDIPFHTGTAQDFRLPGEWDVISMLFHVMSYQVTDAQVEGALARVAEHLEPGGVFVFDYWHSEGVRRDPPAQRVRESEVAGRKLFRVATPTEDPALRRIDIRYEFRWDSPDGECVHQEDHRMRHFSTAELTAFLGRAGLATVSCTAWKRDSQPGPDDWYGLICARRE